MDKRCIYCQVTDEYLEEESTCRHCGLENKLTPFAGIPSMSIPGNMTYNGQNKVLIGKSPDIRKKQQARVPLNIIDENPDGSVKVTRIGDKRDINND